MLFPSFLFPLHSQSRTADEVSTLSIGYIAFEYCLYCVPISEGFRCGIRVLVTVDEFDARKNFASPRYDLRGWILFIGLSVTIFHGKFRIKRLGISGLVASGVRIESAMKYCFTNIAYLAFFTCFFLISREKCIENQELRLVLFFFPTNFEYCVENRSINVLFMIV